jgi:hypothetical protein
MNAHDGPICHLRSDLDGGLQLAGGVGQKCPGGSSRERRRRPGTVGRRGAPRGFSSSFGAGGLGWPPRPPRGTQKDSATGSSPSSPPPIQRTTDPTAQPLGAADRPGRRPSCGARCRRPSCGARIDDRSAGRISLAVHRDLLCATEDLGHRDAVLRRRCSASACRAGWA